MLAYVFWHRPGHDAAGLDYVRALQGFHDALAGHPPAGYRGSVVFALPPVPWAPGDAGVFEDWYLVEDFAALAELEDAAVTAPRRAPHDAAAAQAAWGAGGLYGLRAGELPVPRARHATWLGKPPGTSYEDFDAALAPAVESGVLFQRRLVLGPAPEFCLLTEQAPALPPGVDGLTVATTLVYGAAG